MHYSNMKFQFFSFIYYKKEGGDQLTFVMQRKHKILLYSRIDVCVFLRKGTGKVCTTKILEQNKTDEDIFLLFLLSIFLFSEHTTIDMASWRR